MSFIVPDVLITLHGVAFPPLLTLRKSGANLFDVKVCKGTLVRRKYAGEQAS